MSRLLERAEILHEWGIEPVPQTHRTLGPFDMAVLWGDLGIGLLVLVAGGLLVPGLGFGAALGAIVLGSLIGVTLLSLGAAAGAGQGLPTMVLLRPVLGTRGSWLPSYLNALQLIGWTAVELWAMSYVADLAVQRAFGISARPVWLVIAAVVCVGLALWGPVGVTRVWMKRFAAWLLVAIVVVVTLLLLTSGNIASVLGSPGNGSLTFGLGLDLVIAMPISWLPLVADYTRFVGRRADAFGGTFIGYLVANIWLYTLGTMLVLSSGAEPSPAGIAAGIFSIAGGTVAGVFFLVGLLVGETDEAFADIYSGAVSLQNVFPNAPQRVLITVIGLTGTALAGWLTMERYETFLFLIGSVFVPLFGVFMADHYVNRRSKIDVPELYRDGLYHFAGGVRLSMVAPWLVGFVLYHWIAPVGPVGWVEWVGGLLGDPLLDRMGWAGASIPSFLVAFVLALRPGLSSSRPSP